MITLYIQYFYKSIGILEKTTGEFQYNLSGDRLSHCNLEAINLLNDKLNYAKVKKKNLHDKKKSKEKITRKNMLLRSQTLHVNVSSK